jgi:hypothetical protein
MKEYWGNEGISPHIPDLGTRWRWEFSFTPRPLYPQEKSPWYPLDRRLNGPQSISGHGGEERNSQPLPALEPPIIDPVSQRYTAELSRLLGFKCNSRKCFEFWGHGDDVSSRGLPGCDTVWCCGRIPTFRRSMLTPSSEWSEGGDNMYLWNAGILPQHHTVSQPRITRLERKSLFWLFLWGSKRSGSAEISILMRSRSA